jgi:hypothetical protein
MANIREAERQSARATRDTMRTAADKTTRIAATTTDAAIESARVGADLMQRNFEMARQTWELGGEMARSLVEGSMGQFARVSAGEGETATGRASRSVEGTRQSATALASGMQVISREWLDLSQRTLQKSVDDLDALAKCRNAPELLAVQSEVIRDRVDDFVDSTCRMAEQLIKTAEKAVRKANETATF